MESSGSRFRYRKAPSMPGGAPASPPWSAIRETGTETWSPGFETPLNSFGLVGLAPGTEYEIKVTHKNASGEGPPVIKRYRAEAGGDVGNIVPFREALLPGERSSVSRPCRWKDIDSRVRDSHPPASRMSTADPARPARNAEAAGVYGKKYGGCPGRSDCGYSRRLLFTYPPAA